MVAKNGRKRGNGFYSQILRMSLLLLILGMVVLECEAKPAEPGVGKAEVKDSPLEPVAAQETKVGLDDVVSDSLSLMKTRLKRDVASQGPAEGQYEDGKGCEYGGPVGEPGQEHKDLMEEAFKKSGNRATAIKGLSEFAQNSHGKKCKSGKCHFNSEKLANVCGPGKNSASTLTQQSTTLLIATLLGVSFLRIFNY